MLIRRLLQAAAVIGAAAFVTIMRGAAREKGAIDAAESSRGLYIKDRRVCAGRPPGRSGKRIFDTYPSETLARTSSKDIQVAHCGACGRCSNMHDMTILATTTHSLTDDATWCSTKAYLASLFLWKGIDVYRSVAEKCMRAEVGFTEPCLECWLDDMVTSIQSCVFTCLKSKYILFEPKNGEGGQLSSCLECDERLAGPAFLKCSGSNRRRMGIHSDIGRDDDRELCRYVDMDWDAMKTARWSASQTSSSDSAETEL